MMAINLNSFNFWVQLLVSLGFLLGFIWGGVKVVNQVRLMLHHGIATKASDLAAEKLINEIEEIKKQYKPNSGSTMRDAIDRIENAVGRLDLKLDMVQSELDKHLGAHEGL
jgi:hypothetical protein